MVADLYKELRDLSARYDIKVITAQQHPRLTPFFRPGLAEQITETARFLIIDYIDLVHPETLDTCHNDGRLGTSIEGAPDALRRFPRTP